MSAWLGPFSLAIGLFAAVASASLWSRAACHTDDIQLAVPARQATWLMLLGAAGAAAVLEVALITSNFGVRFVAENSSRATPLYYRITSMWSALDGSLLLWVLLLTVFAVVAARWVPNGAAHLHPPAMAVISLVAGFFFAVPLFTGHAFERLVREPADGPGPLPLLADHPAMGVHPPLLYAGYVGLVVPFGYAIAALIVGDAGRSWLTATRTWTLAAWTCLTAGIAMGAWWSYAVLGWGGYWAWDPVENASLLPWLTTTALLHSALVQRRRDTLRAWNVALAAASFLLVCLGTFLTRSGAVASVHSFTQSPLGPLLLAFVLASLAAVLGLLVWRADRLGAPAPLGGVLSRETALLGNNLLLVALAATVLVGTLFPLVAQVAWGEQLSVGATYFDRIAVPAALGLLVLLSVGPFLKWAQDEPARAARRIAVPVGVGLLTVAVLGLLGATGVSTLLAFGLGAVVLTGSVREVVSVATRRGATVGSRRRILGAHVAHAGFALAAVAIAASSSYTAVRERQLTVGDTVAVRGVAVRLVGVDRQRGDATMATAARLAVTDDGRADGFARPALRYFPARDTTVSVPAIRSDLTRDVYLTVLDVADDSSSATVRLAVNPLVGWLWVAAAVMVAGAVGALVPARRRPRPPTTGRRCTEPSGRVGAGSVDGAVSVDGVASDDGAVTEPVP